MSSASVVGKLERLLNLTAALLNTERLLPAAEIQAKVAGYAADKVAFRRTFERDKNDLRRMGIPLAMGTVPATDPPVEGYRIHKQDYYLTDPGLEADERAALHLAARTVRLEDTSPDAAFWALGGKPSDGEATPEMAVLPSDENLVLLYRAICERCAVSFGYRGEGRSAEPLRLHFARGHWYLGAHDRRRDDLRHFRLDRIDDLQVGPAGAFTPRLAPARDLGRPPWEIGTDTGVAHLEIDAEVAGWALAQTGDGLRHERRPDGSLWLEVSVANTDALLDFVLGLLERAELLGPPDLREKLLQRLRAVATAPAPRSVTVPPAGGGVAVGESAPRGPRAATDARRQPTLTSTERMQRLLQVIPWVAGQDGASLEDIVARFDYPAEELLRDLEQVVFMVGVPPYTPDALIEVEVDEGWVQINFAEYFRRPLRLTPPQAVALLVAGAGLLGVAPDSALERGLAKLARSLGVDPKEAIDVHLGTATSEILTLLQDGCRSRRPAAIGYYSYDRDARTERVIEPYRVFAHDGAWYVRAHCRLARHERTFRIDRIDRAELIEETFTPPAGPVPATVWEPPPGSPRVDLLLEPGAQWILAHHPTLSRQWAGDRCVARLEVGGVAWLERLLLLLGPAAQVLRSDGIPTDLGPLAARRILARYGE